MPATTHRTTASALDAALSAHRQWKQKLREMIRTGKSDIDAAAASRHDSCELGKWLNACTPAANEQEAYERVVQRHSEFHASVGWIVHLAIAQLPEEAEKCMDVDSTYSRISTALITELMNWKKIVRQ